MSGDDETIGALLARARLRLDAAGIAQPRREARLLMQHALGHRPARHGPDEKILIQPAEYTAFASLVERRAKREPMARITGTQGFWTLDLAVSGATLIPRADSECLIESLLSLRRDRDQPLRMLDLGTGSGCLLLAALSEYRQAWGVGIDLCEPACGLAAANARMAALQARAAFLCASWTDPLTREGPRFDVVLSNPPYVRTAEIATLMPEVSRFEPRLALDGGADGLDAYRSICSRLDLLLAADGIAILELGVRQIDEIPALARQCGLAIVSVRADLSGVPRAIALRRDLPGEKIFGSDACRG